MAGDRKFRSSDPRQAAEAAFKAATTKPVEPLPKPPAIPGAKELVSMVKIWELTQGERWRRRAAW